MWLTIRPKPMRKLFLLLLAGTLSTACIDKDYDLEDIDTDNVTIGGDESKFTIPLAKVLVSMNELADGGVNIEAIFREADIWLPSPLPENKQSVDLQLLQTSQSEVDKLLEALTAQMLANDNKLNAVADLLCEDKYIGTFLPLLPAGTTVDQFKPVFITVFKNDATLRETLSDAVKAEARSYLTTLRIEPLDYEVGHIDIGSDIVDMLADNLDPATVTNPKNTLYLKGSIANELPVSLHIAPLFDPTEISFNVDVVANTQANPIPDTRLFAEDLRTIVEGITIRIPVTLKTYFPGKGFQENIQHQIAIDLSLLKTGGLKLDI